MKDALRNAVRIVALLNIPYFGVEFIALFADSIDFLEDALSMS
jgi:Co/Zn/Cd efflux system component